jgi:prepilin-type N-terminal cleavage/methylation domain-containing protein
MRNFNAGLTLIEVLIAASILLILLGLITNGIQSGGSVVSTISSQRELIEETRYAGNIISDEISRAVYVYRSGLDIALPSSYKTRNPTNSSSNWTVGSATSPILAMIQPPTDTGICNPSDVSKRKFCMTFVAYYPVLRTVVMANADDADKPKNPGDSDNVWVIYEYRQSLAATRFDAVEVNGAIKEAPLNFSASTIGSASILADYISPSTGFLTFTQCTDPSDNVTGVLLLVDCTDLPDAGDPVPDYSNSVRGGQFVLSAKELQRGKIVNTLELKFPIAPRNASIAK